MAKKKLTELQQAKLDASNVVSSFAEGRQKLIAANVIIRSEADSNRQTAASLLADAEALDSQAASYETLANNIASLLGEG